MPLEPKLVDVFRQQVGAAAAADQRRQTEDATKKRAVVSAATYGEFKALVDTCHLRPLSREAMARQPQRQLNPHAAGIGSFRLSAAAESKNNTSSNSAAELPLRSQIQLKRQWEARDKDPEEQCGWLLQQPQEGLHRLFCVDIEPQLLLQVLRALALHLSTLAASRCSSCCCCCQTRSGTNAARPVAAAPPPEDAFCCRIAYRVSLTAGFLTFLMELQGTARGARLLLPQELQQLSGAFGQALAALHAPTVGSQSQEPPADAAPAGSGSVCSCKHQEAGAGTSGPAEKGAAEACCQTQRAVGLLLRVLGAPEVAT